MSFLAVIPSIHQPYTDACLARMAPALRDRTLVLANDGRWNRGVAASWNVGAYAVLEHRLDWLISISAATRFGPSGGVDFLAALDRHLGKWVVESEVPVGWHLIAWSRTLLEEVGLFDENFWPAYGEDWDISHRILTASDWQPLWAVVEVDAWLAMQNHGCRLAGIEIDHKAHDAYLEAKWGTLKADGRYSHPFGDSSLPLSFWPAPPDPRAIPHAGWGLARV